ncbi:HAD-IB family phosphatase [bacterium]|nr:HAD-IB family phosphatase [candidate division CSSED10-310 bacterium]
MNQLHDADWLVISDVDGTLTQVTSVWEYLHKRLGKWDDEGVVNLREYCAGRIDYVEFARRDSLAYAGLSRTELSAMVSEIPRRIEMDYMLRTLHDSNCSIALVSSGLDILVDQIQWASIRVSNRLIFQGDYCTGETEIHVPIDGKADWTERLIQSFPAGRNRVIAIGDSRGDIPVFRMAGFAIAVAPTHPDVAAAADVVLDGSTLAPIPAWIETFKATPSIRKSRNPR